MIVQSRTAASNNWKNFLIVAAFIVDQNVGLFRNTQSTVGNWAFNCDCTSWKCRRCSVVTWIMIIFVVVVALGSSRKLISRQNIGPTSLCGVCSLNLGKWCISDYELLSHSLGIAAAVLCVKFMELPTRAAIARPHAHRSVACRAGGTPGLRLPLCPVRPLIVFFSSRGVGEILSYWQHRGRLFFEQCWWAFRSPFFPARVRDVCWLIWLHAIYTCE